MNCENCEYSKLVIIEDKFGKQVENECLCLYEYMPYECAVELGCINDWKVENGK